MASKIVFGVNGLRDIQEVINDIPQWRGINNIEFEPLNGGLTNITYKVSVEDKYFVVRINGTQNDFLKLKRNEENLAIFKAAELGIAPKLISSIDESEYVITEFIDGHPLNEEEIHNKEMIIKVTGILKAIHSMSGINRKSCPFSLIDNYLQGAKKLKVEFPDGLIILLNRMEKIRASRCKDIENTKKYCHNDYHTGYNMLHKDGTLTIIDWELSGIGDAFFDLATISTDNHFNEMEDKFLLESYFGAFNEEQLNTLLDMKFVCMMREIAWALLHAGIDARKVNHQMDYLGFAKWVTERLHQGIVTL